MFSLSQGCGSPGVVSPCCILQSVYIKSIVRAKLSAGITTWPNIDTPRPVSSLIPVTKQPYINTAYTTNYWYSELYLFNEFAVQSFTKTMHNVCNSKKNE